MSSIVGVSIGDPNGVGIHILIDCWKGRKIKNFILFTDIEIIKNLLIKKGIYKKINIINKKNKIFIIYFLELNIFNNTIEMS